VLGKRLAIEKNLGRKLNLSEPTPVTPDAETLASMFGPAELLTVVMTHIESAASKPVSRNPDSANILKPFDRRKVYVLSQPFQDASGPRLEAGTMVVESSLEPGWLDLLVGVGNAVPVADPRLQTAQDAALNAMHRAAEATRERQRMSDIHAPAMSNIDARPVQALR
jgi:hypothetical protein